jgi:hypothetical protein
MKKEKMTIVNHKNINIIMLENQLFAPALKGVIDFGCAELHRKRCSVLRTL